MPAMKHTLTTLFIGLALTLTACGKDKKPANTEPAKAEPAAADPVKSADPAKDPATAAEPPKGDDKPKTGGW
jgi:hypothetical protein